jgi:hypothetical protein
MPLSAHQVIVKWETVRGDFSLVHGGPLYRLLLRSNLIGPAFGRLGWRIGVITALAWLPMVPLTILGGRFAGVLREPFLYDYEVHTKLLFSLPLMILAEIVVYMRMRSIPAQFVERRIITINLRPAFDKAVSSAMRMRNSVFAEIALLLLVVLSGHYIWPDSRAPDSDTWYATVIDSVLRPTPAGRWYAFVSVPVFQFILLRWYYRLFIWSRFLFQVSRLDLNLVPLHPDRCCGLGFLGNVTSAFWPLLMAHSALAAGFVATLIVRDGTTLLDYKFELIGMALFLLLIFLAPLCVFIPKLNSATLAGFQTYGRLENAYAVNFAGNGIQGDTAEGERFRRSAADIRSLVALGDSFRVVREIKLVPIDKETIVWLAAAIALPLAPLALTLFPLKVLFRGLSALLY